MKSLEDSFPFAALATLAFVCMTVAFAELAGQGGRMQAYMLAFKANADCRARTSSVNADKVCGDPPELKDFR